VCARPVACESIRSVSPYTRLFRSRRQFGGSLGGLFLFPAFVGKHLVQKTERLVGGRQRLARRPVGFRGLLEDPVPLARILLVLLDRKSTRLNSSHVSSSYAVFCLQKKTAIWTCRRAGANRLIGQDTRHSAVRTSITGTA